MFFIRHVGETLENIHYCLLRMSMQKCWKKNTFLLEILSERMGLFAQELEELGDVKLISLEILQLEEEMNSSRGNILLNMCCSHVFR